MLLPQSVLTIGYRIEGKVVAEDSLSNNATINMVPFDLYHPEMSLEEVLRIIPQGVNDNMLDVGTIKSATLHVHYLFNNTVTLFLQTVTLTRDDGHHFSNGQFKAGIKGKLIYKQPKDYYYIKINSLSDIQKYGFAVTKRTKVAVEVYFNDPVLKNLLYICPKEHSIHAGIFLNKIISLYDCRRREDILEKDILNEWKLEYDDEGFYYRKSYKDGFLIMSKNSDRSLWIAHYESDDSYEDLLVSNERNIDDLVKEVERMYVYS
ncbi:hypothetical protein CN918_29835 [Priestia megaterium]|nr:hypothetical protein CN918_29835 [Priestia megaterium]